MVNFFATEETVTINLDDQHYVEIKRGLDYGEEGDLEGAAINAEVDMSGDKPEPKLVYDMKGLRTLKLALYICDWNLTGHGGKAIPLPEQMDKRKALVSKLDPKWAKLISDKIDELRAEDGAPEGIKVEPEAGERPTLPGAASAPGTHSSSPSGSVADIETFSARRTG